MPASTTAVAAPPVPITILTGFLGAGKTTLLNRILQADHGLRVAVLVNDFGAINIDSQLVVGVADDESTVSLVNGCICCTIRDDLLIATLTLLKRPNPPQYILLEASGVSDPLSVAVTFMLPELRPLIRIDSIVTVVDAEQVRAPDEYAPLIAFQIAAADIVVLNKVDLIPPAAVPALHAWIREIVPPARILDAVQAAVPLPLILGVNLGRVATDGTAAAQAEEHADHDHDHDHEDDHEDDHEREHHHDHDHNHSAEFSTGSYTTDQPLSFPKVRDALDALPTTIFRAKGVLALAEVPDRRTVVQVVGKWVALTVGEPWGGTPPRTELVFIGPPGSVDTPALAVTLDACVPERLLETARKRMDAAGAWVRRAWR